MINERNLAIIKCSFQKCILFCDMCCNRSKESTVLGDSINGLKESYNLEKNTHSLQDQILTENSKIQEQLKFDETSYAIFYCNDCERFCCYSCKKRCENNHKNTSSLIVSNM